MNTLQESKLASSKNFKASLLRFFILINFITLILTFMLNFLGQPEVKYAYLLHVFIAFSAVLLFEFTEIIPIIVTLYFLDGQGRIVWEYANWARVIFDAIVFISVIRIYISHKRIIDLTKIPITLVAFITLHFLWYGIEFSNLYSLSAFSAIAATKIYIYPILYFLGISQLAIDTKKDYFQTTLNFIFLILILETALTIFQFYMKDKFILQISPYYSKSMREIVFVKNQFRPYGTTHYPGAISTYFFLWVGLLFLKKPSKAQTLLRTALIGSMGFAIVLCQVRSTFIKFIIIVVLINFGELLYSRFSLKGFFGVITFAMIFIFGFQYVSNKTSSSNDESLDYARDRISSLAETDKIKNSRLDIDRFSTMVLTKILTYPLGFGPGSTGAAASVTEEGSSNRYVNQDSTWSGDNIFVALIIDFGVGAIFYILLMLFIPYYFFRYLVQFYYIKSHDHFKPLLICFCISLVILIGNWGAVGITYNPESFAFWFFAAIGFSTIAIYKKGISPNAASST